MHARFASTEHAAIDVGIVNFPFVITSLNAAPGGLPGVEDGLLSACRVQMRYLKDSSL